MNLEGVGERRPGSAAACPRQRRAPSEPGPRAGGLGARAPRRGGGPLSFPPGRARSALRPTRPRCQEPRTDPLHPEPAHVLSARISPPRTPTTPGEHGQDRRDAGAVAFLLGLPFSPEPRALRRRARAWPAPALRCPFRGAVRARGAKALESRGLRPSSSVALCALLYLAPLGCRALAGAPDRSARPNVLLIVADDLGYGELGAYGQTRIRTPHLDRLARQGLRFARHYAGSAVCAPSRCVLLTGRHTGHAAVRDNSGWYRGDSSFRQGQYPLPEETPSVGQLLQRAGYATACIGKWGLGGPANAGEPQRHGFDHFFGYLCQAVAHNHYPTHLWRDRRSVELSNRAFSAHQELAEPPPDGAWPRTTDARYAPDLLLAEALAFVRRHREGPFFLYFATTVPHAALQVPADSLAEYAGAFEETPYLGDKNYLPHPTPRAAYAAMDTRLDRDVGRLLALLDELGIADDTLVLFTSDNGPTFNGGTDSEFFASTAGLRGLKGSLYEGGLRVPLLARWPGRVAAGTTSALPCGFQDLLPTLAELVGAPRPHGVDGKSFLPTLLGEDWRQRPHRPFYWELGRQQALLVGDWKLVRRSTKDGLQEELYDLAADPAESRDLAAERPEVLGRLRELAGRERVPCADFPSPWDVSP